MNIGYICQRGIVTVDRSRNLVEAAAVMRDHHIGALVVVDESGNQSLVVGVITDRDIVVGALARGEDPTSTQVGSLVTGQVFSVSEDMGLSEAIGLMREGGVRRLLVTDSDQQLVGVVSLDDVMDSLASELNGVVSVIRTGLKQEEQLRPSMNGIGPGGVAGGLHGGVLDGAFGGAAGIYRSERTLG